MGKRDFVIYTYKSIVEATATEGQLRLNLSLNMFVYKNPPKILSNIKVKVSSVGSGTLKIWNWRMNLGHICDLPPAGGAAAQTTVNFSISFQKNC